MNAFGLLGWRLNLGLLLLLGVIALGFAVALGATAAIDRALFLSLALRDDGASDTAIAAARFISGVGNVSPRTWITLGLAAWLGWDRRFGAALAVIMIVPFAGVTSSLLKEAFARARPTMVPALDQVSDLSFPSGHAAGAMALCLTAALLIPGRRPGVRIALAIMCAGVVGMTRILLGVHFPTDVLGGWLWGAGIALIGVALAHRYGISSR
ncbi:MAG: phosphatase PAP2 family protein [Sphingomonadaceae bacterium]